MFVIRFGSDYNVPNFMDDDEEPISVSPGQSPHG